MTMLSALRSLWRRLPDNFRRTIVRTGLPYAASFVSHYKENHRIANFAGSLEQMKVAYADSRAETRAELLHQFDSVVDALVMPNAIRKTTYANRLTNSVAAVLSAIKLPHSEIRVLDLPASTGIASTQSLALLLERYRVASYVLGDLYHKILYDPRSRCIFDEQGNLLQVAFSNHYFSLYRGQVTGDEYTFLSACLLFPHSVVAWYLRRRHRFEPGNEYRRLLVVHPEVEGILDRGVFRLEEMDIFQPIVGSYDLILSFNLLQRNYFAPDIIEIGVNNLAAALCEGGVLIMGNTESFHALQKQGSSLISRLREGSF
jgi:chemotaxis methyl-accepting protein methylase